MYGKLPKGYAIVVQGAEEFIAKDGIKTHRIGACECPCGRPTVYDLTTGSEDDELTILIRGNDNGFGWDPRFTEMIVTLITSALEGDERARMQLESLKKL